MDPRIALQILDMAGSKAELSRQQHNDVQQAVMVLAAFIDARLPLGQNGSGASTPENGNPANNDQKSEEDKAAEESKAEGE